MTPYFQSFFILTCPEVINNLICVIERNGSGFCIKIRMEAARELVEHTGLKAYEIGERATNMTIKEIESPSDAKPSVQHLVFSAVLVERESS